VAAPSCTESCSELSSVVSAGAVTCDGASGPAAAAGAVSVLGFGVTPPPPCPTAELRRSNGAFDDTLSRRSANERGARGHDSQLAVACSPDRLLLIRSVCVRRLLVVQGEGGREGGRGGWSNLPAEKVLKNSFLSTGSMRQRGLSAFVVTLRNCQQTPPKAKMCEQDPQRRVGEQ
jgi:hypothetical protein